MNNNTDVPRWHPRVTALVPAYNGADFIVRTLDSLAVQTWSDLEILVGDDCSTDDTLTVVKRFAARHPNVTVVERDANLGWLRNSNDLMSRATGELLFFAFHDDLVAPTYVEKLVEALRAHPRAVLAFTDVDLYDVDGTSSRCVFRALDGMRSRFLRGLVMATYPTNWWVPNRGLFRASAFRDIGGIHPNEQGEYSADWTWLLALALRGEFVRVPEALCEKYFKPNSLSKNWPIEGVKAGALRRAGEAEIQRSPLNLVGTLVLIALLRLPRFMPPSVKKIARGLAGRRGRATRQTRS